MFFRFSLYGFLKNQQYYDPFLILAFREKGLSFTAIGLLIGFREICTNIMEVPTGAVADIAGRRRCMIFSFLAYSLSFVLFGFFSMITMLFVAMLFFSIGEAFRTGTHKAIIFNWLERNNMSGEKTRIYGYTRSWSKIGSAVSVVIAAVLVFTLKEYSWIFLFCIIPYVINIFNILSYPSYLDGPKTDKWSFSVLAGTLLTTLKDVLHNRPLRRLLTESMGFEGCHKVCKDYLQPVLQATALALPFFSGLADRKRTAVLVGVVYLFIYLLSSFASRHAITLSNRLGSEDRSARWIWRFNVMVFALLVVGILAGFPLAAIIAFMALTILQNFWRPILISRVASHAENKRLATVLSIESQAKTLFAACVAPLLGLAVDFMPTVSKTLCDYFEMSNLPDLRFLPVGLLGLVVGISMILTGGHRGKS